MSMYLIQIILLVFLLFALSRVVLRFRDRHIRNSEFVFWSLLFASAIAGVLLPNETTNFARFLGIGRGVDLIVYASIATLFYLVFRIYVMMEDIRHDITELVRQVAFKRLRP